jgi:hypothetical protein
MLHTYVYILYTLTPTPSKYLLIIMHILNLMVSGIIQSLVVEFVFYLFGLESIIVSVCAKCKNEMSSDRITQSSGMGWHRLVWKYMADLVNITSSKKPIDL